MKKKLVTAIVFLLVAVLLPLWSVSAGAVNETNCDIVSVENEGDMRNTRATQRETRFHIYMSPYGEGYSHTTALNYETTTAYTQEFIYAWYRLYDANTGALYNTYESANYSVKLTIYDPDGNVFYSYEYTDSNDANWIGIRPDKSGRYTATAELRGDLECDVSTSFDVVYDAYLTSNYSSASLNLNGTNSKTFTINICGNYPGDYGLRYSIDSSIASFSWGEWNGNSKYVTVTGRAVGSTTLTLSLYENYTGNKETVATINIPITVTANTYTISYNANGGSGAPSSQTKYYGTPITLSSTIPSKFPYGFAGWCTNSSGTGTYYDPGDTFSGNANTTLYAMWDTSITRLRENEWDCAEIFFGGEMRYLHFSPEYSGEYIIYSTGSDDTKVYLYDGDGNQLSSNDDGGEGNNFRLVYNFTAGTDYFFGVKYYYSSTTGDINFSLGRTVPLTYNANGGTGAPASQKIEFEKPINLSSTTPTRTGYIFKGWAHSSSDTVPDYQPGDEFYWEGNNVTLYAVWQPIPNELTVNSYNDADITYGGEYKYYSFTPSTTGEYVIYSTSSSDTKVYLYDENDNLLDDDDDSGDSYNFRLSYTLTAGEKYIYKIKYYSSSQTGTLPFTFGKVYTVSYYANGGSGAPTSQKRDFGQNLYISSTQPTRSGYVFLGWNTSSAAMTRSYKSGDLFTTDANTSLYAVWAETPISMSCNTSNSAYISAGGYSKTYSFTPSQNGNCVIYSSGSDDTRVYLYDENWNSLISDDDGGDGNNFRLQYNLTSGKTYYYRVKYYSSTKTGTINFYFGKVFTISFNANGGSGSPSAQYKDFGKSIMLSSTTPRRTDYTFLGWSTSSSATSATYQPGDISSRLIMTLRYMLYGLLTMMFHLRHN